MRRTNTLGRRRDGRYTQETYHIDNFEIIDPWPKLQVPMQSSVIRTFILTKTIAYRVNEYWQSTSERFEDHINHKAKMVSKSIADAFPQFIL
jgi:hypothetical protein